jgi:exodeoxyribonuclease VII small subunit
MDREHMPKTEIKPIDKLTYEQAFAELEIVVSALEAGEQSLDEALALFERGQGLTKHCAELLEKAELKIRKLTGETLGPFEEKE